MSKRLGVIVWSPHLIYEGISKVLDNLEEAGVTDIAAIAQVAEPAADVRRNAAGGVWLPHWTGWRGTGV